MQKTILITGSTDGIGLEAAKLLASSGHRILLHGRSSSKLEQAQEALASLSGIDHVEGFVADLSDMAEVEGLARAIIRSHTRLDVLINNAGVFATTDPITKDGLDVRFVVNTIAPYLLTQQLLSPLGNTGRVINLSSAAQSPVDPQALTGAVHLPDGVAYAQSKLALTMWSRILALSLGDRGPAIVAVNPGSMLATKMVKQAYGVTGASIGIGGDVLRRAALEEEFALASGKYFDNDAGRFASPHPDALDLKRSQEIVRCIESVLDKVLAR